MSTDPATDPAIGRATVRELIARERAATDLYETTGTAADLATLKSCTRAVQDKLESGEAAKTRGLVLEECDERLNEVLEDDDQRLVLCVASDRLARTKRQKVGDTILKSRFLSLIEQEDAMKEDDLKREAPEDRVFVGDDLVLAEHQKEGVAFLLNRADKSRGAMLAFTMGLGKTLTTISFFAHFREKASKLHAVVLCPLSVVDNWKQEYDKYVDGGLSPKLPYEGCAVIRDNRTMLRLLPRWIDAGGVVVISYDTLKAADRWQNCERFLQGLYKLCDVVAFDEMHELANPETEKVKKVTLFETPVRIGLSGTPLANNIGELHSLTELLEPGLLRLDAKAYKKTFTEPIMKGLYEDATDDEKREGKKQCAVLRQMTSKVILFKTWTAIELTLPEKREFLLVYKYGEDESEKLLGLDKVDNYFNRQLIVDRVLRKTKVQLALNLIRQFGDEGVLVFSAHIATLQAIHAKHGDSEIITGVVKKQEDRTAILDSFKKGEFQVLLLSYGVGAVGINCQAASRVLLLDPMENPVKEAQAVCRAWRMGQNKPVTTYRFAAFDTVEIKKIRSGIVKTNMTRTCIEGGSSENKITREEVRSCEMTNSLKLRPLSEAPDKALRDVEKHVTCEGWGDYDSFYSEHADDRISTFTAINEYNKAQNAKPRIAVVDGTPTPVPASSPGVKVGDEWHFVEPLIPIVIVNATQTIIDFGSPPPDEWHYEYKTNCTYEDGTKASTNVIVRSLLNNLVWKKEAGADYTVQIKSRYRTGKTRGPWSASSAEFLLRD